MKLLDLTVYHPVRRPDNQTPVNFLKATDFEITMEAGIVTVRAKDGKTRVTPVANVIDATPLPETKK